MFKKVSCILLLLMLLLCACGQSGPAASAAPTDTVEAPAQTAAPSAGLSAASRIISTGPTNTEILLGLGLGDSIVGIDVYSAGIEGIGADIPAFDFYTYDPEAILALDPDVIVATAFDTSLTALEREGVTVYLVPDPTGLDGIGKNILAVGALFGLDAEASAMAAELENALAEISAKAASVTEKRAVYFELQPAPNMYSFGSGVFLNSVIEFVGGENVFADMEGYFAPDAETIISRDPHVIISNASYMEGAAAEIPAREGFEGVTAVKNGAVTVVDSDRTSRASQHIAEGVLEIARAIYPEIYS